jgi:ribosome assembly protein SQT1
MNSEENAMNDAEGGELPTDLQEEDDYDDSPVFVGADDAVEVEVDDNDVPMDDDDDDDEVEDIETDNSMANVTDMSNVTIQSHATNAIYAIASHYDEPSQKLIIVSGGGDDKSYLHSVDSSRSTTSMLLPHEHSDSVSCVTLNLPFVSEDLTKTPPLAAVGGYDGAILLYSPLNGEIVMQLEGPTDVECLAFHPKGGTVLLAGSAADGTVWMYHLPLNKCLQVFVGHESAVTAVNFTPDGRWAVSASSDGTVRVWAPKSGKSKHVFRLEAPLTSMAMGGGVDGMLVIVGAEDGQAHVCHTGTLKLVCSLRHFEIPKDVDEFAELPTSVETVAFSPGNPNWCATGGVDGVLKIWDLANDGQCRHVCRPGMDEGNSGGITRLQWHPSVALVFTCYTDGSVRLWDARNGQLLQTLTGSTDVLNDLSVQFTNGGKSAIIMTASDDGNLRIFHVDIASLVE